MTPPPPVKPFNVAGIPARVERNVLGTSVYVGVVEHRLAVSDDRRNARLALLAASRSIPARPAYQSTDEYIDAFNSYQREVLDPLREHLRSLITTEEHAFLDDLEEVYS